MTPQIKIDPTVQIKTEPLCLPRKPVLSHMVKHEQPLLRPVKTEPCAPKLEPHTLIITLDTDDEQEEDELIDDEIMEHAKAFVDIKTSPKLQNAIKTLRQYESAMNKLRRSLMTKGVQKATFKRQNKTVTVEFKYDNIKKMLKKPKVSEE